MEVLESSGSGQIISNFDDVEEDDIPLLQHFSENQVRRSTNYTSIKNSNPTRWNSVLSMLNSVVKNAGEFCSSSDEVGYTKFMNFLHRHHQQLSGIIETIRSTVESY